ncbi:flagellar basal-body MS-ring/collar protein FliF [Natranaerofaba carboxydovora]|uniref:flagellar basal-body MS-ring/collar protein FliF n=1 Tax=Natranaerofaba carboxydovora TaxID=2742683 RepID=UPI001F133BCE|nr:flagellar basal-body MS-ring/collar protein FliF [Natranaerofaba carboxydovora]UMZ73356.1 Flagellar M-ring protein [Natranaerofaba carboxydovora]
MEGFLNRITNTLKEFWTKLSIVQRFTFAFLALFLIVGGVFAGSLFFTPDYTELARNLDADDAGAMVDVLEEHGISYSLEDGGSTILVPKDDHSRVRLQMAEQGLPRHGVFGYQDLDDAPLGLTESERQLRQRVALEGELVRTISMYPEVENARVHIVTPEDTLFRRDERDATAAVYLDVARGRELENDQVKSIMNLVAHSVENLSNENVTITSGSKVLSDDVQDRDRESGARGEVREQLEIQSQFQDTLQQNVQSMLEEVLGVGNVIVRVTAELDFDELQSVSELFEPVDEETGEGILVSMHEVTEFFEGSGTGPGGVVGDEAVDTPEYPGKEGKQESLYERSEETRNYEVNRIIEEYKQASGDVQNISVSVAIDDEIEDGDLDDEQVESIQNLVQNALGLELEEGGDQVTVERMPFDRTMEEEWEAERERAAALERRQQIIQVAIWVIGLLVAFVLARRFYKGYKRRAQEESLRQEQVTQQTAAADDQVEVKEDSQAKRQISDLAKDKPDEFVKILRTWLSEDG